MKAQERLARQWQMLAAISATKRGLSLAQLVGLTGIAKTTAYRDLQILVGAGLPLRLDDRRYRLLNQLEFAPLGFNTLQIVALQMARLQLASLEGTPVVAELDRLLASLHEPAPQLALRFSPSRKPRPDASVVKTIDQALRYGKRATIEYRAASRGGAVTQVEIEPLLVNVADGDPYVHAYCVDRRAERTYKLCRISQATLTDQPSTYRSPTQPARAFKHAVKAWSGDLHEVRIRFDEGVAWLAREYPLPEQIEENNADGSVTITATVAGLTETQRRVLASGSGVEVLDPKPLRKAVRDELATALARYDHPGPARTNGGLSQKSTRAPKRILSDRGTRAG